MSTGEFTFVLALTVEGEGETPSAQFLDASEVAALLDEHVAGFIEDLHDAGEIGGVATFPMEPLANGAFSLEEAQAVLLREAMRTGRLCMECETLLAPGTGEAYNAPDETDDYRTCAACMHERDAE